MRTYCIHELKMKHLFMSLSATVLVFFFCGALGSCNSVQTVGINNSCAKDPYYEPLNNTRTLCLERICE